MAEGAPPTEVPAPWFLDACVLYPQLLRSILVGVAEAGLVRPYWSDRVLTEWRIAAARAGGMTAEAEARARAEEMAARFPDACLTPDPALEASLRLPDPGDTHVAAAAAATEPPATIITLNMRDFPARRLAPHGLSATHPDGALWALHDTAPDAIDHAIRASLAALSRPAGEPAGTGRAALKRAGLPRLAKAWAAAQTPA